MADMLITLAAARHLISARNPEMTVEVATKILEDSEKHLLDERTETGELYFAVPELGGRLIVKDTDPDYPLVAVAFVRERKTRRVDPGQVAVAKEIIKASVARERK